VRAVTLQGGKEDGNRPPGHGATVVGQTSGVRRAIGSHPFFVFPFLVLRVDFLSFVHCLALAEGMRKLQLDGDLTRIRSGGGTGAFVYIAMT